MFTKLGIQVYVEIGGKNPGFFRDRLLINKYVMHETSVDSRLSSSISPFPFKEGMGEYIAACIYAV